MKSSWKSHVLVVEDEPAISESVSYALRRHDFEVTTCATITAAERVTGVDLVLLDLMLPDGSGFDFIGRRRQAGDLTPIIVLSSRDGEADRVAALETGADDYVPKPFSPREVVARVRAVLRRHRAAVPTPSGPLPLRVDEARRRAEVNGAPVDHLTRVEFDLLAALLESPGTVYNRAELIDRVWGDGFAITDRTVDSHVKSLRRKLTEAGGGPDLIETVRGVGYRVREGSRA
ncbi:MAG: response regulator transcription factor [Polyangiaceae bacterium]|nr:response regulator transcription factor [Polyangiaceae bacterium]MCW5789339.1 response regulator transcription factor [Polyangiaceae bacterium]